MVRVSDRSRIRLGELFATEKRKLLRAVRWKLFDVSDAEAEDIVQDVFLNILRRGDMVSQVENLAAYLYRSLANRITDRRRMPLREISLDGSNPGDDPLQRALEPVSPELDPEELLSRKHLRERLRRALGQLKPLDREIWVETELEGRSFKELAEEWQEPIGTLLSRKSRAGKLLRELLAEERSY